MLRSIVPLRRRTVAMLSAAALAIAGVVTTAGPIAATEITSTASGNPKVIWGTHNGPTDVRGGNTYGTVASMAIPAGRWFITAKGYLQSSPTAIVTCQLVAGSDTHSMTTALEQSPGGGGQWQSFVVMTTHRFTSPGTARLRCQTNFQTGDVLVRSIRMTAMQVGKLTTVAVGGSPTTIGSGKPEVRALSGDPEIQLNGGMVLHDVASLDLPAGLWWITAAASVTRHALGDITCRLETPVDFDDATSTVVGYYADQAPVNLQVTHKFDTAGTVRLRCLADVDQYVTNTRIVAVRAGHLTNRQMGGAEYDYGSGTPQIISGFRDDGGTFGASAPTLASLALPAGSWMLSAKLYLDPGGNQGLDALCKLTAGSDIDQVNVALDKQQRSIVSLVGAHTFGAGGGTARLTCRSAPDYPIHAYWIKLTAIRASGLTQQSL